MSEEYELMHIVQQLWNEWSFECLKMLGNVCLKYHISKLCLKIFVLEFKLQIFLYIIRKLVGKEFFVSSIAYV